jgi:hypothetical protein
VLARRKHQSAWIAGPTRERSNLTTIVQPLRAFGTHAGSVFALGQGAWRQLSALDGSSGFVEELRINFAKHEVPKARGMVAEMPGYARVDLVKGSLYWQFIDTHGGLQKLDRREAANFFLDSCRTTMTTVFSV